MEIPLIKNQEYIHPKGIKPKRIVAAAILHNGRIWTGKRHSDLIYQIVRDTEEAPKIEEQGFYTDNGRFVTRKMARLIAIQAGQLPEDFRRVLTSEKLW